MPSGRDDPSSPPPLEGEGPRTRTVTNAYVVLVAAVSGAIVALEWARVRPESIMEYAYLALVAVTTVPLAILLVSAAVYAFARPRSLPRATPPAWPRVAVLYTGFNDTLVFAIAETLRNLEYPSAEVWLLTDSNRPEAIANEAALPSSVRVFRRAGRRGGKAGAINDWLRGEGDRFEYVVPMDADAILRSGSLRALVEIAEHPANRGYAGFQSLMEVHPALAPSAFARILGRSVKWGTRIVALSNQWLFGQGMYWGSNALLRTASILSVGGWVEDNICEDFALTARLDAAGWPIALVDVYNYEGFPPDALSLRERTVRWCRANLSVAPSVFRVRTGFAVRLSVVTPILFYAMAPALLALLVLCLVAPPAASFYRTSGLTGVVLLAFVFFHRLIAVRNKLASLRGFAATLALETLVILGMSLRITWAIVVAPFRKALWVPSRKNVASLGWRQVIRASWPEVVFGGVLLALVADFQPPVMSVLPASVWILSFLATPWVLWVSSRPEGAGRPPELRPQSADVVPRPVNRAPS